MNEPKKAIRDKKWLQPMVDDDPREDQFQTKSENICSGGSAQPMWYILKEIIINLKCQVMTAIVCV